MLLSQDHDMALNAQEKLCAAFAGWKWPTAIGILRLRDGVSTPVRAVQVGMLEKQHRDHSAWKKLVACTRFIMYLCLPV